VTDQREAERLRAAWAEKEARAQRFAAVLPWLLVGVLGYIIGVCSPVDLPEPIEVPRYDRWQDPAPLVTTTLDLGTQARSANAQALVIWRASQQAPTLVSEPVPPPQPESPAPTTTLTTEAVVVTTTHHHHDPPAGHPCAAVPQPGPGPVMISRATIERCYEGVAPFFNPEDLIKALLVIECESNGDPYANDHWIGKVSNPPRGIWSILNSWETRGVFGEVVGAGADRYSTVDSSRFASWLVYHTSGGWGHWASCLSKQGRAIDRTLAKIGT